MIPSFAGSSPAIPASMGLTYKAIFQSNIPKIANKKLVYLSFLTPLNGEYLFAQSVNEFYFVLHKIIWFPLLKISFVVVILIVVMEKADCFE